MPLSFGALMVLVGKPVKIFPEMIYYVSGGTLNLTVSPVAVCGSELVNCRHICDGRSPSDVQLLQLHKPKTIPVGSSSEGAFGGETSQMHNLLSYVQNDSGAAESRQHSHGCQTSALQGDYRVVSSIYF